MIYLCLKLSIWVASQSICSFQLHIELGFLFYFLQILLCWFRTQLVTCSQKRMLKKFHWSLTSDACARLMAVRSRSFTFNSSFLWDGVYRWGCFSGSECKWESKSSKLFSKSSFLSTFPLFFHSLLQKETRNVCLIGWLFPLQPALFFVWANACRWDWSDSRWKDRMPGEPYIMGSDDVQTNQKGWGEAFIVKLTAVGMMLL